MLTMHNGVIEWSEDACQPIGFAGATRINEIGSPENPEPTKTEEQEQGGP